MIGSVFWFIFKRGRAKKKKKERRKKRGIIDNAGSGTQFDLVRLSAGPLAMPLNLLLHPYINLNNVDKSYALFFRTSSSIAGRERRAYKERGKSYETRLDMATPRAATYGYSKSICSFELNNS